MSHRASVVVMLSLLVAVMLVPEGADAGKSVNCGGIRCRGDDHTQETQKFEKFLRDSLLEEQMEEFKRLAAEFKAGRADAQQRTKDRMEKAERARNSLVGWESDMRTDLKQEEHAANSELQKLIEAGKVYAMEAEKLRKKHERERAEVTDSEIGRRSELEKEEHAAAEQLATAMKASEYRAKKATMLRVQREDVTNAEEQDRDRIEDEFMNDPTILAEHQRLQDAQDRETAKLREQRAAVKNEEEESRAALLSRLSAEGAFDPLTNPETKAIWSEIASSIEELERTSLRRLCADYISVAKEDRAAEDGDDGNEYVFSVTEEFEKHIGEAVLENCVARSLVWLGSLNGRLSISLDANPAKTRRRSDPSVALKKEVIRKIEENTLVKVTSFTVWCGDEQFYPTVCQRTLPDVLKGEDLRELVLRGGWLYLGNLQRLVKDSPNLKNLDLSDSGLARESDLDDESAGVSWAHIDHVRWDGNESRKNIELLGQLVSDNKHPKYMTVSTKGLRVIAGENQCYNSRCTERGNTLTESHYYESNNVLLPLINAMTEPQWASPNPSLRQVNLSLEDFYLTEELAAAYLDVVRKNRVQRKLVLPKLIPAVLCANRQRSHRGVVHTFTKFEPCPNEVTFYNGFVNDLAGAVDTNGVIQTVHPFFVDRDVTPAAEHVVEKNFFVQDYYEQFLGPRQNEGVTESKEKTSEIALNNGPFQILGEALLRVDARQGARVVTEDPNSSDSGASDLDSESADRG